MKKKIKLVHILHSDLGGTASVVMALLNLKKTLIKENLLFTGPRLNIFYKQFLKKKRIKLKFIKILKYFYIFSTFRIYNYLKKKNINVIILHNYQIFPSILYKVFNKVSLIYVDHKAKNLKTFRDKISILLMYIFADRIVCINKKNFYSLRIRKHSKKIIFIQNPVDEKIYKPKVIHKKNKKNFFKIGMASRINNLKLHDLIINAIKEITKKKINIICEFAGNGETKKYLENKIKNLKLEKKVKFIGVLNEKKIYKWLTTLDLYVQASKGEGMATIILQAMATGVPVIGSKVEGNIEILEQKPYVGKLFKNNKSDLIKKIDFFYSLNKAENQKYINNGISYIKSNHYSLKIKEKYFRAIKTLNKDIL